MPTFSLPAAPVALAGQPSLQNRNALLPRIRTSQNFGAQTKSKGKIQKAKMKFKSFRTFILFTFTFYFLVLNFDFSFEHLGFVRCALGRQFLVDKWFQILFQRPHRPAFHLSLTVLVHYRSRKVFSLA